MTLRILEVVFARLLPGVLNVLSIIYLNQLLSATDYGVFSTGLATTGLIALLFVGHVGLSILPRRAAYEAKGQAKTFEQSTLSLLLVLTSVLAGGGTVLAAAKVIDLSWVALAVASALFTGWLPVLRARLQFWRYGAAALGNAVVVLAIAVFLVPQAATTANAIWAYATGNFIGFVLGWAFCGMPRPGRIQPALIRNLMAVGSSFTLSNLAENGLFLGIRYSILWFGSAEFLGLFSYAVDVAQRSVGVVINITSFAIVPRAYKKSAEGNGQAFIAYLKRATILALGLSAAVYLSLLALRALGLLHLLLGDSLSFATFTAVSIAIIVNRLKKMTIDPLAVHVDALRIIPVSYMLVAPLALGASIWSATHQAEAVITYIYPAAYVAVAGITAFVVFGKWGKIA